MKITQVWQAALLKILIFFSYYPLVSDGFWSFLLGDTKLDRFYQKAKDCFVFL